MARYLILLMPLLAVFAQNPRIPREARAGYESITANDLRAHLTFLASPELEGRETTFRGQKTAAGYIAAVFQKLGLKPIGDRGSYFQRFEVEVTRISDQSTIAVMNRQGTTTYEFRKDYLSIAAQETTISAPAVFIGYMDSRLDGADAGLVKGKIVVALAGRRVDARDTSVTSVRRVMYFRQFPGSVATLVVADETGSGSIEKLAARFSAMLDRGSMRMPGAAGREGFVFAGPRLISPRIAAEILRETGRNFDDLCASAYRDSAFKPIDLSQTTVRIEAKLQRDLKSTENVVGLLEGSDPKLKEEAVVFTAHYDHAGVGNDGAIFHGADDDGSGTVSVLELAEAFVTNPVKPKRSLLFITVTGEEKGLLGSQYYVTNPLIPLNRTVANLNTDMIGRIDKKYEELRDSNYVYVIGSDKISTQLDSLLKLSNKESENLILDYKYNDDKDPQQFYKRSDHYNFARNGIPIVFFFTGIHDDYHRPTDTVDKILFDRMARIVRLTYYTGWKVANSATKLIKNVGTSIYSK